MSEHATKLLPALMEELRLSTGGRSAGRGYPGGGATGRSSRAERTGAGSFLMEDLARGGMGAKGSKDLRLLITPLSKGYEMPKR